MLRSILIILVIVFLLSYFQVSVGGVINFFVAIYKFLVSLAKPILDSTNHVGGNTGSMVLPQIPSTAGVY